MIMEKAHKLILAKMREKPVNNDKLFFQSFIVLWATKNKNTTKSEFAHFRMLE